MDDEKKAWFTSIFSFNNCWYFFKRWLQYKRCLDFILHMYSNSKKVEFFKVSVLVLSNPFNEKIRLLHCVLELFLSRLYNMETAKNCFKRRHHASVIYFVLEWNEINPSRALVWNLKVLGERVNESCFPICHVQLMLQKGLITVVVKTYWSKKTKKLVNQFEAPKNHKIGIP